MSKSGIISWEMSDECPRIQPKLNLAALPGAPARRYEALFRAADTSSFVGFRHNEAARVKNLTGIAVIFNDSRP